MMDNKRVNLPKITIVTVVYNGKETIEQTLRSVTEQSYANIEYIVIDGGSTDGTLDIIKEYQSKISYWISEPDQGIADAMNKGIKKSTGDYLLFLHADDRLLTSNSIGDAVFFMNDHCDLYAFNILYGSTDLKPKRSREFNFWTNVKTGVWHQGVLFKQLLFESIGGYDIHYKIAMDYDWFLRAYRAGFSLNRVNMILSVMGDAGISSRKDAQSLKLRLLEEKSIHLSSCNSWLLKLFYRLWWAIYPCYKLKNSDC